jgi:hypothetical protein
MHIGFWMLGLGVLGLGLPLAINFVFKWIVIPIRLKEKSPIAIAPRREPTLPEKLSPEMRQFLGQKVREFRDEGFETVANNSTPTAVVGVDAIEVLLVNRERNEIAVLIVTWTKTTRSLRAPTAWASRQHLRFANAPFGRRSGQFRPDQIELLRIALDQGGFVRRIYRLEARLRGSTATQPLFLSMDRATLEQVKNLLLHALGITPDPMPNDDRLVADAR